MESPDGVDGSISAVAQRIQARREAGKAPIVTGDKAAPPSDEEDRTYQPRQNVNTPDGDGDDDRVTAEQLRQAALGDEEDQESAGENEQRLEADDDLEEDQHLEQDDGETGTEDEPGADDSDAQGVELTFQSVDELAEIIGIEVDDLLSRVTVDTLVDGEPGSITLADMKKGHQLESSFTRKNQAFVSRVKNWEAERESQRTQIADHFAKATTALNMAQQQLYSDYQSINWDQLGKENPAEWTKKRQELGERQARLNQAMQQTTAQIQQAKEQQQRQEEEARENRYAEQHELLMAAVPTWKKSEQKRVKEGTQIAEYLVREIGFTPEEIENLEDHRLILLGRAALGLSGPSKQKLNLAKKKVDEVKKFVRPGNGQDRRDQGKRAFTKRAEEAKATLKKTGATHDAAQALLARKLARQASAKRGRRARV